MIRCLPLLCLLPIFTMATSGCVRAHSISGGDAWQTTHADSRPTDAGPTDAGSDVDTDGRSGDTAPPNDLDPCQVDQTTPPALASCGTAPCPVSDPDCDGLPDYRDPYKDKCNALLYEETFPDLPNDWSLTSPGDWQQDCGAVSQTSTDDVYRPAIASQSSTNLSTVDYLVEARIRLGAHGASAVPHWGVGVAGRVTWNATVQHFVLCELWVNPNAGSNNPVTHPDLHLLLKNTETDNSSNPIIQSLGIGGWPDPNEHTAGLDGEPGETYYLQLWVTGDINTFSSSPVCTQQSCPAVVCRLCTESQCIRSGIYALFAEPSGDPYTYLTDQPGTVGVRTVNRAASFDYVRVFELINP